MITRIRLFGIVAYTLLALVASSGASFAATAQAWLLISEDWKDSVISTDAGERDALVKGGWKLNGTGLLQGAPQKGVVPLNRLARPGVDATDRMLEPNASKVAGHVKEG